MIIHYELPDDLHRALKVRAAQESITLKALIIRFLELGLSGELVEGGRLEVRGSDEQAVKQVFGDNKARILAEKAGI